MAEISKITLPSGSTYDIKDSVARSDIADIKTSITGGMHYIGTTTTALTDGSSTNPITIGGASVTAKSGDIAIYGNLEFIFSSTDSKWHEFGSTGSLKALAFKDSASGNYTPAGSVSKPTFTGTAFNSTGKFTPSGSVTVSIESTENKSATVTAASSGTATYTPAGSVSKPTFTGSEGNVSVSGTPSGSVGISVGTGTANYTPAGSVSVTPTVTVNTTTVNSITGVGTLPSCTLPELSMGVTNETLSLSWSSGSFNAGTLPTKGSNTTVATGIKSATATGAFTGTGVELKGTFTGTALTSTGKFTPTGSVSQPTFTGTGARLVTGNIAVPNSFSSSFTGTEDDVTVSGTATGEVSKPTFTGTAGTISVS